MTETLPGDRIYSFPGGLKLRHNKQVACRQPIAEPDLPERLYVQVVQHQGSAGDICVEPGDRVAKGQRLTAAGDDLTVPEHAPTSGRVVAIADHPAAFPRHQPALHHHRIRRQGQLVRAAAARRSSPLQRR